MFYSATKTSTKKSERTFFIVPQLIVLTLLLSGFVSFITVEYSQLREQLDFNSRILEAAIYIIPFTMPVSSTHVFSICSITLSLIWFNAITMISIFGIKRQMQTVKEMSPQTDVTKKK